MDKMSKEKRHRIMSRIKSRDTKIEIVLRRALWGKGIRYRKNYRKLPGSPDIVIRKYKIAIFCDSEFFHGYDWDVKGKKIGTNREFWVRKIERNMQRDRENEKALRLLGWTVIRFWGEEILKRTDGCIRAIEDVVFQKEMDEFDIWD